MKIENNLICECANPIPQVTLSTACQTCFKGLKKYAKEYFVIVWHERVTEVSVFALPNESVLNICKQALRELNISTENIESPVIDLNSKVQDIKFSVLLKYIGNKSILYKA